MSSVRNPIITLLSPQSQSSYLDAGRLINFFIWHSSCYQFHKSFAIKDKIAVSMYINIHVAAFLLGCLPAQRCGAVYCHVLKFLHLDIVPNVIPHVAQPSRPDIVWVLPPMLFVGNPRCSSLLPSKSGSNEKRDLLVALAFQRIAQQIARYLFAILNMQYIVPVVGDLNGPPDLVALSPKTDCSSQSF